MWDLMVFAFGFIVGAATVLIYNYYQKYPIVDESGD